MPKKTDVPMIQIDNVEYEVDKLSNEAKEQITNIHFVDQKLQQLSNELAVADTARMAYLSALKNATKK